MVITDSFGNKYDSPEGYIMGKTKMAIVQNFDSEAKGWILAGSTMFPKNFKFHIDMFRIQKSIGDPDDAARYFSQLLSRFQHENELWIEVEMITSALRAEGENIGQEKQFLRKLFTKLASEMQHQLLVMSADRCDDTMEHCHLLLLLFNKFPQSIVSHGPRLIETLLSAEKHSHSSNHPVNCYRKLLVSELLPLLGDTNIELSSKLLYRLINKAIEFYLYSLMSPATGIQDSDSRGNDIWFKLFQILDLAGRHLKWDPYLTTIGESWNRESYWQKVLSFCQMNKSSNVDEHVFTKQLLYCLTTLFLNSLYDYKISLCPDAPPGQIKIPLLMVEAFVDASLPPPSHFTETSSKRRKAEIDSNCPHLTIDKPGTDQVVSNFIMASNCWDLLRSTETLQREFQKLISHLKLDSLLSEFTIDYSLYKQMYDETLANLPVPTNPATTENTASFSIIRNVRLACIYFWKKNYAASFEHLYQVVTNLPSNSPGDLSKHLIVGGNMRHLHYLPVTQNAFLQYCVRILIAIIQETINKSNCYNENALGNLLTLIQFDWGQNLDMVQPICDQIKQRGSFHFPLFETYIIKVDILEEIMYLWAEHGGKVTFDIFNSQQVQLGQRRIGTRGADKGVKEDFKLAMKRQVSRSNEAIDKLIIQFITQERHSISQCFM